MTAPSILVIGGGITGLAAAVHCVDSIPDVSVTVFEAGTRWGGKINTSTFAGHPHIDEGADAFLARAPSAVRFARRVGLGADDLTSPEPVTASIWHDGLHNLPPNTVLGVPTALRPFVTTTLLSWRGKLRASIEPLLPARAHGDALGALIRYRFGREVHERLVDSLIGSIYATDTDRSSLAAVPQLAGLADAHRSLLLGARARKTQASSTAAPGPIFYAPRGGMRALVDGAVATLDEHRACLRLNTAAADISRDGDRWRVNDELFDAVICATPASAASTLLAATSPDISRLLARWESADVAMVRLAIPTADWPSRLAGRSGYLVPKPAQRTVTAASFGSQKWRHWANGTHQVIRASLGRDQLRVLHLDDAELVERALDEVGKHLDFDVRPTASDVVRWPAAFPQYRPFHHQRVATVEAALPEGLTVAGASYHGIGVPSCISSGIAAATRIAKSFAA